MLKISFVKNFISFMIASARTAVERNSYQKQAIQWRTRKRIVPTFVNGVRSVE